MTVRSLPEFASRPPRSRPFRFVYFVAPAEDSAHAAYHAQLVTAEVLLHRLMYAKARGVQPVNLRLRDEVIQRFFTRSRPGRRGADSPELIRWVDKDGFHRRQPLSREQLTQELMERQGISLRRALSLVSSQSHALLAEDQAWLEVRARLPVLQRPLNGAEYATLVLAIEAAFAVPGGGDSRCAGNVEIALYTAGRLGGLHRDYTPSPFRVPALSHAYLAGHHDYLARRAAFAAAAELRLRFSHAKARKKMDAKLACQRTEHAALLAGGGLATAKLLYGAPTPAPATSARCTPLLATAAPSPLRSRGDGAQLLHASMARS
jgi:hypothetical protein